MAVNPTTDGAKPGADALAAAFAWWREAGVDFDYASEPTAWLRPVVTGEAVTSPTVPISKEPARKTALERALDEGDTAKIGGSEADWPQDLHAFRDWWLTEKSLSDAPEDRREAPVGKQGAKLGVLTPFPLEESEAAFLAAILRAYDLPSEEVYRASATPAALFLPDWADLGARGLADVTRRHMALAQPGRLLVFDRGLAPLFALSPQEARVPTMIDFGSRSTPVMIAPALTDLARSPERRKTFWNRWLEWTA